MSKSVDRIKAINKFKGYVWSVLPMHEHKLLSLQCQLSIAMSTIDCSRPQQTLISVTCEFSLPFNFRVCVWRGMRFWPTVLSVEPMVQYVVCLSVVCLSVTFCIVAKRCILAKKCLKEWIGNQGQKVHFLGRCHISTSGFAATATETAVFALFLPVQPSDWY